MSGDVRRWGQIERNHNNDNMDQAKEEWYRENGEDDDIFRQNPSRRERINLFSSKPSDSQDPFGSDKRRNTESFKLGGSNVSKNMKPSILNSEASFPSLGNKGRSLSSLLKSGDDAKPLTSTGAYKSHSRGSSNWKTSSSEKKPLTKAKPTTMTVLTKPKPATSTSSTVPSYPAPKPNLPATTPSLSLGETLRLSMAKSDKPAAIKPQSEKFSFLNPSTSKKTALSPAKPVIASTVVADPEETTQSSEDLERQRKRELSTQKLVQQQKNVVRLAMLRQENDEREQKRKELEQNDKNIADRFAREAELAKLEEEARIQEEEERQLRKANKEAEAERCKEEEQRVNDEKEAAEEQAHLDRIAHGGSLLETSINDDQEVAALVADLGLNDDDEVSLSVDPTEAFDDSTQETPEATPSPLPTPTASVYTAVIQPPSKPVFEDKKTTTAYDKASSELFSASSAPFFPKERDSLFPKEQTALFSAHHDEAYIPASDHIPSPVSPPPNKSHFRPQTVHSVPPQPEQMHHQSHQHVKNNMRPEVQSFYDRRLQHSQNVSQGNPMYYNPHMNVQYPPMGYQVVPMAYPSYEPHMQPQPWMPYAQSTNQHLSHQSNSHIRNSSQPQESLSNLNDAFPMPSDKSTQRGSRLQSWRAQG